MRVLHDTGEAGWYTDPYGRHEARWMSQGQPTKLVRDAGVDSFDEPPDEPPSGSAMRIEHPEAQRAGDMRRADSAQTGKSIDSGEVAEAVLDAFAQTTPLW